MSDDKYRQYAKKIAIFHGLRPEEVQHVLKQGHTLEFRKDQTIFHEGQLGSNLFVVLNGEIGIHAKNRMIAKCKSGDTFGEMAVLNQAPRNATAMAITDTRLFTLDEAGINKVLENKEGVRILLNIIHVLSERLEEANTFLADVREKGRRARGRPTA